MIGTGFLPEMDEGGFILDYWAPTGAALSETDRQVRVLEGILLRPTPAVQAFTRRTGSELGFAATAPNRGDFTVLLKPRGQRPSVYEVMDRVRREAEAQAPAVRVEFVQLLQDVIGDLAGAPEPVELKLFSRDQAAAERAAEAVAAAIEPMPGLVDLFDGVQGANPERRVAARPGAGRAARAHRRPRSQAQARAALFGADAGTAREPDRLVPIRVRLARQRALPGRRDRAGSRSSGPAAGCRSARSARCATPAAPASSGERTSGRTSRVTGPDQRPKPRQRHARRAARGRGACRCRRGSRSSSAASTRASRPRSGSCSACSRLALGAVLLVLVAQFGSFRGPLAIVLAVPLGLTGALLDARRHRRAVQRVELHGRDPARGADRQERDPAARRGPARVGRGGESPAEALAHAGRVRLRPILMTTVCTLAGLVPLALGLGAGAELQRPLALAVIGGLVLSTLVTLLIVPVLLEVFGDLETRGVPRVVTFET